MDTASPPDPGVASGPTDTTSPPDPGLEAVEVDNPDALLWSTYLGGADLDGAVDLAVTRPARSSCSVRRTPSIFRDARGV